MCLLDDVYLIESEVFDQALGHQVMSSVILKKSPITSCNYDWKRAFASKKTVGKRCLVR